MKKYQAYLFDLDGTLINTLDLIVQCFKYSLGTVGVNKTEAEIRSKVGLPLKKQFEQYITFKNDKNYETLMKTHMDWQLQNWKNSIYTYPDVEKLLQRIYQANIPMVVVTSRKEKTSKLYLKGMNLYHYFRFLVTPESTTRHKPEPYPAIYALKKLRVTASDSLFVGDSIFDIQCGQSAGCDTAFVRWGINDKAVNLPSTYCFDNPQDFIDSLEF